MSSPVELFGLATRGVNVVEAPTHLSKEEVTSAQNVEVVSDAGENALDQRPGMSKVNAAALNGSVVMAQDVPSDVLLTKTPTLYVAQINAAHLWRKSTDGTTWTDTDTPVAAWDDPGSIASYYKSYPKAVTIKGRMFYTGNATTPIAIQQFDGTTQKAATAVPPAVSGATLTTPDALAGIANETYTPGATSYTYKLVARLGASTSAASAALTLTTSPVTLNSTNFLGLTPVSPPVAGAQSYDVYRTAGGATQGKIGNIPITAGAFTTGNGSGLTGQIFTAPAAPTTVIGGVSGYTAATTTYTYKLVQVQGSNHSAVGSSTTFTTTGPASWGDGAYGHLPYVRITTGIASDGVSSWDVYRTSGGPSTGKIGTITPSVTYLDDTGQAGDGTTAPVSASGFNSVGTYYFTDGGLVGDGTVAPVAAVGTTAGNALAVLDTITDGTSLYIAVLDQAGADPVLYGRVLKFSPGSNTWTQLGASFPLALGNGCPGALAFYGGTLSYSTYAGGTAGNTTYVNNVGLPLPAGGVQETHTTAASQVASCMAVFNGDLYVGYSHIAATAATLVKRVAPATWSTSLTAPAAAVSNGWTSLGVFNGKLFAGWQSGVAATAAKIYSTPDGITWTLELTTALAHVPGQMVVFNNYLYVAMFAYGNVGRVYRRDTAGTWTLVDTASSTISGAMAWVYV